MDTDVYNRLVDEYNEKLDRGGEDPDLEAHLEAIEAQEKTRRFIGYFILALVFFLFGWLVHGGQCS